MNVKKNNINPLTFLVFSIVIMLLSAGCGWLIGMKKANLGPSDTISEEPDNLETADIDFDYNPETDIQVQEFDFDIQVDELFEENEEVPVPCTESSECDDGEPCNGIETCVENFCHNGTPLQNGSQCVIKQVIAGWCQDEICVPQTCGNGITEPGEECDDGNFDEEDGCKRNCKFTCHINSDCDDSNSCTTDICESATNLKICRHFNNSDPCNDRSRCSVKERCQNGTCTPLKMKDCNDNNQCTQDFCDPSTDTDCRHEPVPTPANCDDGNPCTDNDYCDETGACVPEGMCDCSGTGSCSTWDDGNPCNGTLECVGSTCILRPFTGCPSPSSECKQVICIPDPEDIRGYRCEETNRPDGIYCDDGNECTLNDSCIAGECAGEGEINCDDSNPCTTDTCQPDTGCVHTPNNDPCSTGLFCSIMETCQNGNCVGIPRPCSDFSDCTIDFCNEETDECVFVPLPDYSPCGSDSSTCCISGNCIPCP